MTAGVVGLGVTGGGDVEADGVVGLGVTGGGDVEAAGVGVALGNGLHPHLLILSRVA